jgi:hypothetical protein
MRRCSESGTGGGLTLAKEDIPEVKNVLLFLFPDIKAALI